MKTKSSQSDLVKRLLDKDYSALEEIMDLYTAKLYYYCLSILRDSADAEEVVQDTFIKVYKKIDTFSPKYKLPAWIYKIALNTAKDKLRQKKSDATNLKISYSGPNPNTSKTQNIDRNIPDNRSIPSKNLRSAETHNTIMEEINRLPQKYREIVLLRHIEDYSYAEIADILNCNTGTVKSRISRAKKILKQHLKEKNIF